MFVYYAGHGMMDNTTYLMLNHKRMYPMEKMLRTLAKADGSYVIALFDCCREKLPPTSMRGLGKGIENELDDDIYCYLPDIP